MPVGRGDIWPKNLSLVTALPLLQGTEGGSHCSVCGLWLGSALQAPSLAYNSAICLPCLRDGPCLQFPGHSRGWTKCPRKGVDVPEDTH